MIEVLKKTTDPLGVATLLVKEQTGMHAVLKVDSDGLVWTAVGKVSKPEKVEQVEFEGGLPRTTARRWFTESTGLKA